MNPMKKRKFKFRLSLVSHGFDNIEKLVYCISSKTMNYRILITTANYLTITANF